MPLERTFISFAATTTIALPIIIFIHKSNLVSVFGNNIKKFINKFNISKKHTKGVYQNNQSFNDKFSSFIRMNKLGIITNYEKSHKSVSIYIIVLLIVLFPIIMKPFDLYIGSYINQGFDFINYTYDELSAAAWIQNNIPKNFKVYSDPLTVIEMRGLSYRMNIEGIGWNTTLASQVKTNFLSDNSTFAYHNILSNHGHDIVIVISPRTTEWLDSNLFFVQYPIKQFKSFDGFKKYFDDKYFKLQYYNDKVIIFTLK